MKQILQFITNILLYLFFSYYNFILLLWYGKLPKVSIYHDLKGWYSLHEFFNDELAQSRKFPSPMSKSDKQKIIQELLENPNYRKHLLETVPIKNELGEDIGTQSLYTLLSDSLT